MFVGASTAKLEHVTDIVSTEVATLVEGLKLALNIGCSFILFKWITWSLLKPLNSILGSQLLQHLYLKNAAVCWMILGRFLLNIVIENCTW